MGGISVDGCSISLRTLFDDFNFGVAILEGVAMCVRLFVSDGWPNHDHSCCSFSFSKCLYSGWWSTVKVGTLAHPKKFLWILKPSFTVRVVVLSIQGRGSSTAAGHVGIGVDNCTFFWDHLVMSTVVIKFTWV